MSSVASTAGRNGASVIPRKSPFARRVGPARRLDFRSLRDFGSLATAWAGPACAPFLVKSRLVAGMKAGYTNERGVQRSASRAEAAVACAGRVACFHDAKRRVSMLGRPIHAHPGCAGEGMPHAAGGGQQFPCHLASLVLVQRSALRTAATCENFCLGERRSRPHPNKTA